MEDKSFKVNHMRHCMLYEFHKGSNPTTAVKNITAVYPEGVSVRNCRRWFLKFKEGNFDLTDEPRSGRPSLLDDELLKAAVEEDPRQTIRTLSQRLDAPWSTVQEHLKKIGKVYREGRWVPHELSPANKAMRATICNSLLLRNEKTPFLDRIVTGDEKWIVFNTNKRKKTMAFKK